MDIKSTLRHAGPIACAFTMTILLTGCITADPSSDFDQAALLTDGRTGAAISMEEAWSNPFDERSDAWDGISALGLEESITVALSNDPALRRQLALVARKRAELAQASLPPNPRIAFQVGSPLDGAGGAPAMVQLLQQLTWIWTMGDRIDRQDEELQAMILDAARTTVVRAAEVRAAYAEAAYDRDIILLRMDYVKTTRTTLNLVTAQVEAGEVPKVNRERAAIDHHIAEAALANSIRQLRQEKLELLRLMGWPGHETSWKLSSPLVQGPDSKLPTEVQIVQRALEVRLDVAAAERMVQAAEAEARLAGWSQFPKVEYRINWNRNFNNRTGLFNGGLISVPILDNGYAQIANALALLETASLDAAIIRQDVILQARTALNS